MPALVIYPGSQGTGSPSLLVRQKAKIAGRDVLRTASRQDAERSTGGRMPAKQKSQDAMFCVK